MTPGSPPRAAGDHSSLETRGQEGDPVLKGRAMEELLEGLWKLRGSGQPQRPGQQKTSRIARVQRRTAEGWWPGGEGRRGPRETGPILRCAGKAGNPLETTQGHWGLHGPGV